MFYDIHAYPFLTHIQKNAEVISNELKLQLSQPFMHEFINIEKPELNSHTHYWVKEGGFEETQIGYDARDGSWASFPLFKKGFPIKWYDVEKSFPATNKLLQTVPGLNFSSFFRLGPGAGAKRHQHSQSNLIFHMLMFDLDKDSELECGGEKVYFRKRGDYCLFNYSNPHSSFNHASGNRINLVIDFAP